MTPDTFFFPLDGKRKRTFRSPAQQQSHGFHGSVRKRKSDNEPPWVRWLTLASLPRPPPPPSSLPYFCAKPNSVGTGAIIPIPTNNSIYRFSHRRTELTPGGKKKKERGRGFYSRFKFKYLNQPVQEITHPGISRQVVSRPGCRFK